MASRTVRRVFKGLELSLHNLTNITSSNEPHHKKDGIKVSVFTKTQYYLSFFGTHFKTRSSWDAIGTVNSKISNVLFQGPN